MRKKSLILLTSGILGVSLAGGTFAAWAVTDNASPFNIYVSPGEIHSDDTRYVTLAWGGNQSIHNVSGLSMTEKRNAGNLKLLASTSDQSAITGQLSYTVADSYKEDLAQYVVVEVIKGDIVGDYPSDFSTESNYDQNDYVARNGKVYKADASVTAGAWNPDAWSQVSVDFTSPTKYSATAAYAVGDKVVYEGNIYKCKTAITSGEAWTSGHWDLASTLENYADVQVPHGTTGAIYTAFISLGNGITNSVYSTLSENEVAVTFDWGKNNDIANTKTYYATGFSATPYIYLWNSSSQDNNAQFPGVPMTESETHPGYYKAEVNQSMGFDMVIFTTQDETQKSGDLTIATFFTGDNNCFNYTGSGDAKGTASKHNDAEAVVYYVVGEKAKVGSSTGTDLVWTISSYDADDNTVKVTPGVSFTVYSLDAEAKIKIFTESGTKHWYGGSGDSDYWLTTANQAYTVTFSLNPDQSGSYITATPAA